MRGRFRRAAPGAAVLALCLTLGLTLAGCGAVTTEVSEPRDDSPADTEVTVPQLETGMVPAAEEEEPPEEAPAEAPQLPAPPGTAPAAPAAPGTSAPRQEQAPPADSAVYTCYDGLYYVRYDPLDFTPGPAGGADLVKTDGTEVFFARLGSQALTETWLAGMEEKRQDPLYLRFDSYTEQAAGYPVRAVVYQDETRWHAEAVVELGEDRGSAALPMYAVYLTAHGPDRDAVWTDGVRAFLDTLQVGEADL